jgi:hypothetical protein
LHLICRRLSDRSPKSVTGKRGLSVRQRKFAKGLIEGKSNRQSALDAAPAGELTPSGADSWADRTLKDERLQGTFAQMLDRKGLSEQRIAEVHAENLTATKVVATATKEGQITDVLERPDYSTRHRAVQAAWRLRGRDRTADEDGGSERLQIVVLPETKLQIERLVGRSIYTGEPIDVEALPPESDTLPPGVVRIDDDGSVLPDASDEELAEDVVPVGGPGGDDETGSGE